MLRIFTAEDTQDAYGYAPLVSPDGRYLLSNFYGLFIWDLASGEQLANLTRTPLAFYFDDPSAVSFGANALYTASSNGAVAVRDLSSNRTIGPAQELFRTESFTLRLDLSATYLNPSGYSVSGTFTFGDEPASSLSGNVCVPEGLEPQLSVQTSPTECDINFSAGDAATPEWSGTGSTPFGTPPIAVFDVSRGDDAYLFELRRLQ